MAWTIESVRDAAVDPADVFRLYADPSTWSAWGHSARSATANGPFIEGGIVDVRADYGKVYPCRIRRLEPGRALELEVKPPLLTVVNVYEVDPTPAGSRIRHALEISGPLAGPTRLIGLHRAYKRRLDKEIGKVIEIAAHGGLDANSASA